MATAARADVVGPRFAAGPALHLATAERHEPLARSGGEPSREAARHVARLRTPEAFARLELPVLPDVVHKVWAALDKPDSDSRLVSGLIRHDAAFATHLLRIANSPAYAARSQISSLQQAVSRLGVRVIGEIAVVIACKTRAFRVPGHEVEVRDVFRHSLLTALHAREIARLQKRDVEQAFVGALVHDLGRPTLIQALVDHERVSSEARLCAEDFDRVVTELHAEVGAGILHAWGLPAALARAVEHHHRPELAGEAAAGAALIALADGLAHAVSAERTHSEGELEPQLLAHAATLNLYPEEVLALIARGPELSAQAEGLQ